METPEIIVSLDIGTTKIAAMVGRRNEHDKIEILGKGKSESMGGVTRGIVTNISCLVLSQLHGRRPFPFSRNKARCAYHLAA